MHKKLSSQSRKFVTITHSRRLSTCQQRSRPCMLSTVSLVRLVSHRFLSSHHNVTHFHTHFTTPALSTPALSTPANSAFPPSLRGSMLTGAVGRKDDVGRKQVLYCRGLLGLSASWVPCMRYIANKRKHYILLHKTLTYFSVSLSVHL